MISWREPTAALVLGGVFLAAPSPAQPAPAPPLTIRAVGLYRTSTGGDARLDMSDASRGTLSVGGKTFAITGDSASATLTGTSVALAIKPDRHVVTLSGTIGGKAITLTREVERPISSAEVAEFDPGPEGDWKTLFDGVPDYARVLRDAGIDPDAGMFWYNFGPIFYRGRLDGSARVLVIASDPGPTECLPFVRRPMVGDAGQRVQGFLARLGIDRSYILVNAYAYAMRPSFVKRQFGKGIINEDFSHTSPKKTLTPEQTAELHKITKWRNDFFTKAARAGTLEAIVPMGGNADPAYDRWIATLPAHDPIRKIPVFKVAHPSAVDRNPSGPRPDGALEGWQQAIPKLRKIVKPDTGMNNKGPNYGQYFTENDYARVPRRDLPKEAPLTIGDNSDTRQGKGGNNDASRPSPDDFKTLVYTDPKIGEKLKYVFENGQFHPELTTDGKGKPVQVDAKGIPIP